MNPYSYLKDKQLNISIGLHDDIDIAYMRPFANNYWSTTLLTSLKNNIKYANFKIGTSEPQQFKLDGSCYATPDDLNMFELGLWSSDPADENGVLKKQLLTGYTLDFEAENSFGITIYFDVLNNIYATEFEVTWYYKNNIISNKTINNNKNVICFVDNQIDKYDKIEIKFKKINKPFYYLKIYEIILGQIKTFTGEQILSAKTSRHCINFATSLPIDTFDFDIIDEKQDFNIINPQGIYQYIQKGQKVTIERINLNNGIVTIEIIGTYYIAEMKYSKDIFSFHCVSIIGELAMQKILNKYLFVKTNDNNSLNKGTDNNETWWNATYYTALQLIGINQFKMLANNNEYIQGYIKGKTQKEGLEEILIAMRSYCYIDNNGDIIINDKREKSEKDITFTDQLGTIVITKPEIVNTLNIVTHKYNISESPEVKEEKIYEKYFDYVPFRPDADYDMRVIIPLSSKFYKVTNVAITWSQTDNPFVEPKDYEITWKLNTKVDNIYVDLSLNNYGELPILWYKCTLLLEGIPYNDQMESYTYDNPYQNSKLIAQTIEHTVDLPIITDENQELITNKVFDLTKDRVNIKFKLSDLFNLSFDKIYNVQYTYDGDTIPVCIKSIETNLLNGLMEVITDGFY